MSRARSPARRGASLRVAGDRSVRIDEDGNVENSPYAQLGEWVDERLRGATAHAHDGFSHRIEVVTWAGLIDAVLEKARGGLHTGQQFNLEDDSVNFIINGMDLGDMAAVGSAVRTHLPAGCELRMGDARENIERKSSVARRPHGREFFINVTERAQANLERRRKMAKRTRGYDWRVFVLSITGMIVSATMLHRHGEGYRHPFETLAALASETMTVD